MGGSAMTWIFCLLILVVFWLLLIRPQKKKEKQVAEMRKSVKAGDKVLTIGGIKARVIKAKEESLIIEVGEKTRMEVMRWAVSSILEEGRGSVKSAKKAVENKVEKEAEDIVANAEAAVEAEAAAKAEEAPAEAPAEEAKADSAE